ncbi:MAG: hypothetical protein WCW30_02230 [Candidatus Gracilibacteria bacterium]
MSGDHLLPEADQAFWEKAEDPSILESSEMRPLLDKFLSHLSTLLDNAYRIAMSSGLHGRVNIKNEKLQEFLRPIMQDSVDLLIAGRGNPSVRIFILSKIYNVPENDVRYGCIGASTSLEFSTIMREGEDWFLAQVLELMAFRVSNAQKAQQVEVPAVEIPGGGKEVAAKVGNVVAELTGEASVQ